MSTTAVEKTAEKPMEFIPFGAADKIRLSVNIIQSTVCIPTKSGKVCTVRDAMRFMMLCQAQRLNPFAGDCFLCGYDGKNGPVFSLITAHQAFLKRAETCEGYEGMESGIIICGDNDVCVEREGDFKLQSENCVGGWAKVYRKGRKPTYRRLSIAAMMPNYETPFWSEHKAPGQIVKCAEADALRATFPTLLGGLYSGDELNMSATISSVAGMDIPLNSPPALLETAKELTEDTASPAAREKLTPQQELEGVIVTGGFTFKHLVEWGRDTNNIPDADSLTQISEVPTDVAKRLLKAQRGLLDGLGKVKAGIV